MDNACGMRIGILTFHRAHNYGAVLQCYALQEYLKKEGHVVYIIDHLPHDKMLNVYKWFDLSRFNRKNLIVILKEFLLLNYRRSRFKRFNHFIDSNFQLIDDAFSSFSSLDLVIVGSDQVWNYKLTHGFDPYYWGFFEKPDNVKLISYAASMGEIFSENESECIVKYLQNFDSISVREEDLYEKIKLLSIGKPITMTLDPTLLLSKANWSDIAIKPKEERPYLLLYQVRNSTNAMDMAKIIAKRYGLKIIILSAAIDKINSKECIKASPEQFLGWFKYAKFVISSSFHGTVFSLIFNIPFYSIRMNDGKDSRVVSLLNKFDLNSRLITNLPDKDEKIDFAKVNKQILKISIDSKLFLSNYIE